MDPTALLSDVMELLERLGTEVRFEHLGGGSGGICVIRGRRVAFFDLDADPTTRLERCLADLAGLPELETLYVKPSLRDVIERAAS